MNTTSSGPSLTTARRKSALATSSGISLCFPGSPESILRKCFAPIPCEDVCATNNYISSGARTLNVVVLIHVAEKYADPKFFEKEWIKWG